MPPIDNDPMDDDDIADAAELARLQAEEVAAKRIALETRIAARQAEKDRLEKARKQAEEDELAEKERAERNENLEGDKKMLFSVDEDGEVVRFKGELEER